ncbi:D-alanyl-D-alanine carboxypeptidase/D-alanyl-D-alanine endopeptidase [Mycolicibacterium komossense]|uniref:D-alanyl-D-alanine carboxypeptidase/D-alanyl-D-alanine-endopeptidase n=1 Tax=Mycolicibacterium komossense TaxID=1779 RepID=A0ABT3CLZ7_9MYCO|nr:D-alanyl-D-alanine carboxypeptidase/D-alanyl-D-alanine-endopeptidase [Mycolicibacterium komossense]MCV7230505.1 D-alanyl-D-alanine carboxypeptidase/D-alanyl-D-alanine-endopeptidase [Mycolicibacterium komossense]
MRPTRWRRSTHIVIGVVVLIAVGAVIAVAALVTGGRTTSEAQSPPAPTPAAANPSVVPIGDEAPVPTPNGLTQALAVPLADPNLGALTGRIADADTGAVLWQQGADIPMQPASTNKTLTSSAALLTLDRDARVTTRVVAADQTAQPGLVVLVGGGDPTLSAAPPGQDTWYRDAARISDLADQVRRTGTKVTAVQVDTSFYGGPTMAPGWDPADIDGGDIAPMESVMLDAGRIQPTTVDSGRSLTPALDAGRALATALGVDPAAVRIAPGPASGKELAAVQSAPLIERLNEMMNDSDNVMAEAIAREVAAATQHPVSFAGAVEAVTARLTSANIDMAGATLVDSSGLSVDDRLTATTLDEVVGEAAGPDQPKLRPLLDLLPIAGGSGTLSNRFLDPPSERASAGWLRAKTGSLTGTNALAGVVTDSGGRVLTFAFISNNAGPTGRLAIDALAATLRSCGCGS